MNREGACSFKLVQGSISDDKRIYCLKTAEKSCCLYCSFHPPLSIMGLGGDLTPSLSMGVFIVSAPWGARKRGEREKRGERAASILFGTCLMAQSKGRILWCTNRLINDLHTESCRTKTGFSALDCPQSFFFFFFILRRMPLATHFLQASIMLLIQPPKVCAKAAAVSNLATQTHTHDNIEQHHKHNL